MQHRQGVQRVIINGLFKAERFVLREEMEADETQNKVPITSTKYKRLQTEILLHAIHHSEHNTVCCMHKFYTYMKLSTSINFPPYRTIITGY